MKKRRNFWVWMVMGLTMLLISSPRIGRTASPSQPDFPSCHSFGVQRFQEKKAAPAFSLKSLDGKQTSLSDFRGKAVLLTFWATWCASCKEDIPLLEKFFVGKNDQLAILLIAIDGERNKAVQKVVNDHKVTLPVLLLLKEKVMDHYMVRGWVPQTFLIDREGMLVGKIVGQRDWCSPEAWSCLKELFGIR